jgi:hypothetical protein
MNCFVQNGRPFAIPRPVPETRHTTICPPVALRSRENSDRSILTASLPSRLVRSIPTPPHIAYHTYTYIHTVHTYIRHAVPTRAFPTRNTPPRSRQRRTTTQRTRNTTALRTRRGRTRELLCLAIQRGELFLAKATNASRLEQHRRRGLRRPTDRLID